MYVPTRALFRAGQLNRLNSKNMLGKKATIVIFNEKSTSELLQSLGYIN